MLTQKMKQPFKTAQPVLFPPLADRAAWESLPGAARWAAAGQAALADAQTAPELPLSLWLQFTRSGDRAKWEHAYFARRRTLCALAMAEAVTNRGTYLPALADLAWRICEESAWQLPAHNSYIRDTPQLPLPDVTRPIVDLFAAETGALIATVCGLLGEALDANDPRQAARHRGEVGHHGEEGAGAGRPHPDALFYKPLLVDGQRRRADVQLDALVYPERTAGRRPVRPCRGSARLCAAGRLQHRLLFEGLR